MLDLKQAIGLDSFDATLYSNRSLCYLKIGEAQKALLDAETCINNRPDWVKGYYRKGAALMLLKVNDTTVNYCHLFLPCLFFFCLNQLDVTYAYFLRSTRERWMRFWMD